MRKIYNTLFLLTIFSFVLSSCSKEVRTTSQTEKSQFTEDIRDLYLSYLDSANVYLQQIDTSKSRSHNQKMLTESRKWYKRVEPMLIAFDYQNYLTLNAPNILKVESEDLTDIKVKKPHSYQVLEEILYSDDPVDNETLQYNLLFMKARLPFIRLNHIVKEQRDRHYLKMIRDAVVNIAAKGITGFDSPMLANSLQESIYNYETIGEVLKIYKEAFTSEELFILWQEELASAIQDLKEGEFDSFDRYKFIKEHTNQQLVLVNLTAIDWGIRLSTSRPLDPKATNMFDKDFFNLSMFTPRGSPAMTQERVALGKTLFNDPALSNSGTMSCASCHVSSLALTDGKPKAVGNDGKPTLRNTPTLTYAVYQTKFFFDGRGDGIEGQIVGVLNNEQEFHMDLETLESKVRQDPNYIASFEALYDSKVDHKNIRNAIASYVRSLAPFDSKFDRNMQGKEESLTDQEILGFNLFMGKAACATCHFPPAFNGLVPPKYDETEFENLGVPANASFTHPVLDDDPGAYFPFEVEERRHFFKTSTVRNSSLTGPYMHNGVYVTLDELMEFYNVGGGAGMGLDNPYQTLPPDSLQLSEVEKSAVIAFMESLTDQDLTY